MGIYKTNTISEVVESNPSMAVNRLDDDERSRLNLGCLNMDLKGNKISTPSKLTKFNLGRLQNKRFAELQNEHREKGN